MSPRGKVLENGMPRFFRRLTEGLFDTEDLILRTHELAEFVERASETYGYDLNKIVGVGYSNGANIASSLLFLHPRLLAGAVLFRPMVPLRLKNPPDLKGKKILILSGTEDMIVETRQPEKLAHLLRDAGGEVTLHWEHVGHPLTENGLKIAEEWLTDHF